MSDRSRAIAPFAVFALALAGCTCGSLPEAGAPCSAPSDCAAGEQCVQSVCTPPKGDAGDDTNPFTNSPTDKPVTRLEVTPASSDLTCPRGGTATLQLFAHATYSDDSTDSVVAQWKVDRSDLAAVDAGGRFSALGVVGGDVVVTASYGGKSASAKVRITLTEQALDPGVPANAVARFTTLDNDASKTPQVVYPETEVVLPIDIPAPLVQWNATGGTDLFRMTVTGPFGRLERYTQATSAQAAEDQWRVLTEGAGGTGLMLTVDAAASDGSGRYYRAPSIHLRIADATFAGQIYYWALQIRGTGTGGIVRIGSDFKLDDFWQPPDPNDPTNTSKRACIACHALSSDGQKLAFTYDGGDGAGGITDVRNPQPPIINRGVYTSNFSAFDPSGKFIVNNVGRTFSLRAAANGTLISSNFLGPGNGYAGVSQPKFAPNGQLFAYLSFYDNSWEIDYSQSDLYLADVSSAGGSLAFTNHRKLISGTPPPAGFTGMGALSSPTFTPDSKLLAFARGQHSRSGFDDQGVLYNSKIVLLDVANAAVPTELAKLDRGLQRAYAPSFSPFKSGGYYWLAFMARRDYGNVVKGVNRRQIWVAAVDENFTPGTDPSHPAFWLPGQDSGTQNMTAYWAPAQCKSTKSDGACLADVDCCNGSVCRPDGSGKSYCVPKGSACHLSGEGCTADKDCCVPMKCRPSSSGGGNTCQAPLR